MPMFRKKPVVIEAHLWDGSLYAADSLCRWINDHDMESEPVASFVYNKNDGVDDFLIATLEGNHQVTPGDWIIKGVAGEFYPCKPVIFDATYVPEPW